MYRLDHLNGPQRGGHRIVHRRRLDAGSDLSCALWAPLEGLAPRHAVFEDDGERVRVRALDGAPLRVNGREVAEAELREGDLVEIGPLRVRFSRRRWRARDLRRAMPAVAGFLALAFAGGYWGLLRHRRAVQQPLETPPPAPTAGGVVTPSLRIMETVAERLETTEAEHLERVAAELEREREQAPTAPAAPPDPGEDIETRRRNAEAALAAARARAEEGRLGEAEMILARLQAASPDFLEAWAERARIQERQGRIEDALGQWRRILDAGPTSSLHPVAAAETLRLSRLLAATKPTPPPPATTPAPTPPVAATPPAPQAAPPATTVPTPPTRQAPRLRFVAVEPTRFPATAEYEEMRMLRLVVRAEPPLTAEELAAARVEVTFYDILEGGVTAVPTRARASGGPFYLRQLPRDERGDWIVTATYTVPRGWRERERRATGRAYRYHGFLAQAFIGAQWQTAEARPRQLAERVNGRTRANSP